MKHFAILLFIIAGLHTVHAQPFYIMYTPGCMDQLEYRYTYQSTVIPAYSVRPNSAEQYILTAALPGITTPTLPSTTIRCQDISLQEGFLNMVNSKSRAVYVVHQTPQGYTMMPIIAATKVTRQGSMYIFEAPTYAFALDTLRLQTGTNLAVSNSTSYVFLNGSKRRNCSVEYSFHRDPNQSALEKSDFDFIPGIGITNDRTGLNSAQMESNHVRLMTVNGRYLDDYIGTNCPDQKARPGAALSTYTPPVTYSTTTPPPSIKESDKEAWSASQNPAAPVQYTYNTPPGVPPLADCPEPPGAGYHIVQPGENVNAIARTYNVAVKDLLNWNKIKNADKIEVCQKIWLSKPPANAATTSAKGATQPATYNYQPATQQKNVVNQEVYWSNAVRTEAAGPVVYSTTPQTPPLVAKQPTAPSIHIVQRGETLYGIAQRYRLREDDLRRYNQLAPLGDVALHPGDRLVLCNCTPEQAMTAPNPAGTAPAVYNYSPTPAPTTAQPTTTQPTTTPPQEPRGAYTPTTSIGTTPAPTTAQPATTQPGTTPTTYSTTPDTRQPFDPNRPVSSTTPATTSPTTPATTPTTAPADNSTTTVPPRPPVYQEYYVRQGDTIGSVAVAHRVSPQELALINGKDVNETLVAGQRLLIPKY